MLCDRCCPYPRRLGARQLRLTPCRCGCDVCASGPPDGPESNPPPISEYISGSLGWTAVPVAPSERGPAASSTSGKRTSPGSAGSTSSSGASGQDISVGLAESADSDQSLTEELIRFVPQIVPHLDIIVDVGCSCLHGHHGNVSCTNRREIQFSYFNEERGNILLCERCKSNPTNTLSMQV